jgi:GNAT superfamily N-acetyltransferase
VGEPGGPRGAATASIRAAGPGDLEAIVAMRIEFERITRDSGSMDELSRRAELRGLLGPDLASGRLAAWIAEEGGRAVGQAGLRLGRRDSAPAPGGPAALRGAAELLNVYVEPGFRGRGIGTALVRAAIAEARARGAREVGLQPTEDSRRIYERSGFEAEGDRMVLRLRGPGR